MIINKMKNELGEHVYAVRNEEERVTLLLFSVIFSQQVCYVLFFTFPFYF